MANLYFNPEQEKEIINDAGHIGLLVMERYMALSTLTDPVLEDSNLAVMLSVSEQTIRKTRSKLTKAGWFRREKLTIKGEVIITYDIGKKAVKAKYRTNIKI